MKKLFPIITLLSFLLVAVLSANEENQVEQEKPKTGKFILWVTNQSNDLEDVHVKVELNGKIVCDKKFAFGDAHNYESFKFELPKGKHVIKVSSTNAKIEYTKEFIFADQDYGVVTFCYLEESERIPKKYFQWEAHKGELAIF